MTEAPIWAALLGGMPHAAWVVAVADGSVVAANAKALERRLILRSRQIGEFPHSGRKVPDYERDDVRELIEGSYRLVYRIMADHVDVLTVMHCAQLLPTDSERL